MSIISTLIVSFLWTATAFAQDEALPESVTAPYLAFQAAEEAGDVQAAATAAEQAWRAGLEASISPAVLGVLAENAGYYAHHTGAYDLAEDAFLSAVEMNEQNNGDPVVRARALRYVSDAQYRKEEYRRAFITSERAVELLEPLSPAPAVDAEMALLHALMSSSRWVRGQYRNAGYHGERALLAARRAGIQNAAVFGVAAFQAGAYYSYEDQPFESAYWMTVARTLLSEEGSGNDLRFAAGAWGDLERARLDAEERARLIERLREDDVYQPEYEAEQAEQVYDPEEGRVDAVPLERRPPQYPPEAAYAGIEGFALMRFDIDEEGRPMNVEVVYSIPFREFGEEGVRTVRRWTYQPATENGVPVVRRGVMTRLDYQLAD
ncbi:energy transducer TonB [Oceanicaulis sp. MMSF_3324]|uniref:energy transducer TonB n=1 Tax=Oceanicaulis sp. MMSF_3324 TaxID=3046702 RepID=UPI00273D9BD5|nr:energy transducer TonB [Oceanicaulis sp. MMSF_3324]